MCATTALPRHAVILAAGLGSRLRPITNDLPKPLVAVNGTPILHNALNCLARAGVRHATIVVGYRSDAIRASCGGKFAGLSVDYIESSAYEDTGTAYSMWMAREPLANDDSFILEGDVLFETEMLLKLGGTPWRDAAAVVPFTPEMSGSAVSLGPGGFIAGFRSNLEYSETKQPVLFKTANIMRLSVESTASRIVPALGQLLAAGKKTSSIEQLFHGLIQERRWPLQAVLCDGLRWFEVDSARDLQIAHALFDGPRET